MEQKKTKSVMRKMLIIALLTVMTSTVTACGGNSTEAPSVLQNSYYSSNLTSSQSLDNDVNLLDVFDGLTVTYSGLSGKGKISFDKSNCKSFVKNYVSFECEEADLKNGDVITVTAVYDESTAESKNIAVKGNTKQFKVSGLKEATEIDPFNGLEVVYTGASPYLSVSTNSTKCSDLVNEYITFKIDEGYVRNGDEITITATYKETDAEQNGFVLKTESKTYKVENQPELVTSLDGLDLTALHAEMDDKLAAVTATNKGSSWFAGVRILIGSHGFDSVDSKELKSVYFVSLKKNFENLYPEKQNYNRYMRIYEYVINRKDNYDPVKVYVLIKANNIRKNADGTVDYDIELDWKGYSDYDSMINDYVTKYRDACNVTPVKT